MGLSKRARGAITLVAGGLAAVTVVRPACVQGPDGTIEVVSREAVARYDWMQFGGGPSHGGSNTAEQIIGRANVAGLVQLFKATLPETAEGQPVVLTGVATTQGTHDLAFVTSRNGGLVAMDARTGVTIWQRQFAGANITMSSPAVDPSRSFVYGAGIDGKIHKVTVGDGSEVTTGGWPEVASLKNAVEKDGTALTIATAGGVSYLYLGTGGYYGDGGDYQGHLTTVNLVTGAQKVFNALCSNQTIHFSSNPDCAQRQSAIWAKAGVTFDALTNRIYIVTGNGPFSPSTFMWGDSILALGPDGGGAGNGNPVDSYTPGNYQALQDTDLDLGSTNLLTLPNNGSKYPHLAVQGGKDQVLRLINLDDMSGQGAPGKVGGEVGSVAVTTGGKLQAPSSTWMNPADGSTWVYVVSPTNGVSAYQLTISGGSPALAPRWSASAATNGGATIANGVLYYAQSSNLRAVDPTTGAALWSSTAIGGIHWQAPTIANGVVYIADNNKELTAFSLGGTGGAGSGGGSGGTGGTGSGGTAGSSSALSRTGWTATASNTGGADVPARALDGNQGTRWTTGAAMTNGMYFEVDMKAPRSFNQIVMDAGGSTNEYPRAFQIFVSNDRAKYTIAASGTGSAAVVQVTFETQSARYIKIHLTGAAASAWSMAELNVYSNTTTGNGGAGGTGSGGTIGTAGSTGTAGSVGTAGSTGVETTTINCGGPASPPFVADVDFSGGSTFNYTGLIDTTGVTAPAPAAVYQSARLGGFTYTIPGFAARSSHVVRLHMCENFYAAAGLRLFNVTLNGAPVLTSFDIFATAGGIHKPIVEQFTAAADANGQYVIQTKTLKGSSLISGIEIR